MCFSSFKNEEVLKNHQITIHLLEQQLRCELCGKIFGQFDTLSLHQEFVHSEEYYECLKCGKVFKYYKRMQTHFEKEHNGFKFVELDLD